MTALRSRGRRRSSAPALIVAFGLVVTALMVALILQRTVARPPSIVERAPPDFAGLLPAGAESTSGSALELPDAPQPAYAVAFMRSGDAEVGLIVWDRDRRGFALASTLRLAADGLRLVGAPTLRFEPLTNGEPAAIVARGPAGSYADGVFVAMREGRRLVLASIAKKDGTAAPAAFVAGRSAMDFSSFDLRDADGDGRKEIITISGRTDGDGMLRETVEVYSWKDDRFAYDEELSWAIATSRSLFPEPPSS